ncbi:MAG: hypothetical protein ACK47B_07970 [Armatimonadota bacterium]
MKTFILRGLLATALIGAAALPAAAHDSHSRGSSPSHRSHPDRGPGYRAPDHSRHPGQSGHPGRGNAYGRYDHRDSFEHRCVRGESREQHLRGLRMQRERQQQRSRYGNSHRDGYRGRYDDRRDDYRGRDHDRDDQYRGSRGSSHRR